MVVLLYYDQHLKLCNKIMYQLNECIFLFFNIVPSDELYYLHLQVYMSPVSPIFHIVSTVIVDLKHVLNYCVQSRPRIFHVLYLALATLFSHFKPQRKLNYFSALFTFIHPPPLIQDCYLACHGWIRLCMRIVKVALSYFRDIQTSS